MKKVLCFASVALLALGCDKKLDQVNPNAATASSYWQTREQAYAGVTAIYNGFTLDGSYMRSFPGLTDSRGDDFTGDSPWTDLVLTGQFVIPSTSAPVQWIWRDFYLTIFRANQVLQYVPQYQAGVLSTDEQNRLLGQAYFLRGLSYYNLATSFKEVPIITTVPIGPSEYYPATASETDLWNQVYSDFQNAESLLPVDYGTVTGLDQGQKGRATKGAAAGMLGKAYLYRKDWTNAAAQFEKFVLSSGSLYNVYGLMADYRDNFKDVNENNKESLFEVQFSESAGTDINWTGEPSSSWKQVQEISITYGMDGAGFGDYLPTRWIYDEYKKEKTTDGKDDPRLLVSIASYESQDNSTTAYGKPWFNPQANIYPRKYTNDGVGNGRAAEDAVLGSFINYRVLRYADILLMYAEALNELGRTAEAYPFIQQVRTRANLPDLATAMPGMSQDQMRDQLAHERALEFAIEGQRINDLIRWGWFQNPTKLAELKTHDSDFNTYASGHEYLPIPQSELDLNKNLKANSAN